MTAKRVAAQQEDVRRQDDRSHADPEVLGARRIAEPHRPPRIVCQNEDKKQRDVKEVAGNVLHDQRERVFARISFSWFADRACGRVSPERFVIGTTVVVTREGKAGWSPENKKSGREEQPPWPPARFPTKNRVRRAAENFWRIKRRKIVGTVLIEPIMRSLKRGPGRIDNESGKPEKYE